MKRRAFLQQIVAGLAGILGYRLGRRCAISIRSTISGGRIAFPGDDERRIINVVDYGAKADGVTDDTAAIMAAVAAAHATGGVVIFPCRPCVCGGITLQGMIADSG